MRTVLGCVLLACFQANAADVDQPRGDEAWAKFDFIPGDKLLFFEDFAKMDKKLGRLTKPTERLAVQEYRGAKWLHCRPPCTFDIVLPQKLPERFTIDFDLHNPISTSGKTPTSLGISTVSPDGSAADGAQVAASSSASFSYGSASNEIDRLEGIDANRVLHVSWLFDGAAAKGYVEHLAALNAPEPKMPRTARLRFEFYGGDDPGLIHENSEVWITNLRIAGGGNPALFDELSKKGRVAVQGILFDTGSDRIRPESTPALAAIAKVLLEHPELKLTVEGHTDNQGKAPGNQTLSEKRATAVRTWLVAKHKIDFARLEPKGFGQTRPVGTNDTSEGRQANRRVELVKR